jgi:glycosyltransferase involved in cell wall biosynthesis
MSDLTVYHVLDEAEKFSEFEGGGLLVNPGSPEQLADALEKLVRNGPLREEIGAQGLAAFQRNFSWCVTRKNYENLLGKLLQ